MDVKEKYITGLPKQKSINFLFPLTGFKKFDIYTPYGTYLYWKDETIDDYKLIIYYKNIPEDFYTFEKNVILKKDRRGNENVENCYRVKNGMVYIYDMSYWAKDILQFLEGKYSRMSPAAKKQILYYNDIKDNKKVEPGRYIYMSLYPQLFYRAVAEELCVGQGDVEEMIKTLEAGEELLGPYDREIETLRVEIEENVLI